MHIQVSLSVEIDANADLASIEEPTGCATR
jgi:hypothetical protein